MGPALLVPVKTLSRAKSRLDAHPRDALMRAFALDALSAAVRATTVATVYVVTDDAGLGGAAEALGCRTLPDLGAGDLNAALREAARLLPAGPVGVLLGDLPALLSVDLDLAIDWAGERRAVVADAAGTGSTLLLTPAGAAFTPAFGVGSFAAHVAAGHEPVPLDVPSLRRDVDTADDLLAAVALGVGERTAALIG